jgi:hypothetical protein
MTPTSRILPGIAAIIAMALLAPVSVAAAATANRYPYAIRTGYGDYFYNYDFGSTEVKRDNVDWGISLYFYNGASKDRVKGILEGAGYGSGSFTGKYGRANDGEGYRWDRDTGKKGHFCPRNRATGHYRTYADGDQFLYNMGSGSFVVASTHMDVNECFSGDKMTRGSEAVEDRIVERMAAMGYPGYHDYASFGNYEYFRAEGNHVWDSNGFASYIDVHY